MSVFATWIYHRLGVHVGVDDDTLMAALDAWAADALLGGVAAVTDGLRDLVRSEHADARELYEAVVTGRFA